MSKYTPSRERLLSAYVSSKKEALGPNLSLEDCVDEFDRFTAKVKADALRQAANYFAGGLHCALMRTTPEETVRYLRDQAERIEAE